MFRTVTNRHHFPAPAFAGTSAPASASLHASTGEFSTRYKFIGKERQTDIDLNWDSFKYRNYDYAIGRFFNVDPLAEKFPYNGVYNFSGDRVVDSGELEGLESVIKIYGQNNEPTVLQSNNYSSMEWTNVQRAYFSMAKSIKNGTGNWNAYASRNTPPEHGTLNLYYGNNGIEKASFQTPGWSERFANSFSKGQRAFYTIFHCCPVKLKKKVGNP